MLIDKGLTEGDVVSIKLISGEEIIARFESESSIEVKISKPLCVTLGPQGLGMIPWVFLGEKDTVPVKKEHVMVMMLSKKEASDQYVQGTTGIALR